MGDTVRWLALIAAALCVSCASLQSDPELATPDRVVFDNEVWPILVRDCGFNACHGGEPRFFRVLGPGHERLDPATRLTAPVTDAELQLSYDRARSMVDANDPNLSSLLLKPLEVAAGGSGHEGTDSFGRNVFQSIDDPSFQVLARWASSLSAQTPEGP
jgi:hypothetical protein